MRIAEGLEVLELKNNSHGMVSVFNASLLWDENNVILIDTGLPGQLKVVKEEMEKAGVPFDKLNKIIITHHDTDHIGNLSAILRESDHKIEVMCHEGERPYIEGEKRPIKMTPDRMAQLEEQMKAMPEEQRNAMKAVYANLKAKVDTLLQDGEELPYCGGIKVIHTPGHTPGHICLYLEKYRTLITGDAMNAGQGQLVGPNPVFTFSMEEAVSSLKKLIPYDIETVICYHGGIYNDNPKKRIAELADSRA